MTEVRQDFPLFPLPIVLLPTELLPLHIFEERYKEMIGECLANASDFGIVWLSDEGLKEVGCTAFVDEVLERMDDGRMNILVKGQRPFRLIERAEDRAYPTGTIELLEDRSAEVEQRVIDDARDRYAALVERVTDERPSPAQLRSLGAYDMAATVDIGPQVKQGLLEMRSEQARLRLLSRLFKAAMERLDVADRIADQARVNGKVRFSSGSGD